MSRVPRYKLVKMWKGSAIVLTVLLAGLVIFKRDQVVDTIKETASVNEESGSEVKDDKIFSAESLVAEGEFIIFGTDQPALNAGRRLPVGRGQCAFCHLFVENQKSDRCPDLRGIEKRSHLRLREARYEMFSQKYEKENEANSGMKPKAKTGGEYIIESLYCPNCYVVEGFGLPGSEDQASEMPIMTHMPWQLNDFQLVAVTSYLQAMDTPGDLSKVTARQDWERYFSMELTIPSVEAVEPVSAEIIENTALISDPIEVIVEKMRCFVCHKIPSVPIASTGLIGPLLTLKTSVPLSLASPEYKQALKEGRATARTPKEYVIESILNPSAFVLPGFRDGMPSDYNRKFTVGALHKLAEFLLTIDESMIEEEEEDLSLDTEEKGLSSPKFN